MSPSATARPALPVLLDEDHACRFERGAQIDFIDERRRRRHPAILESGDEPQRDAGRLREFIARPIQALASLVIAPGSLRRLPRPHAGPLGVFLDL